MTPEDAAELDRLSARSNETLLAMLAAYREAGYVSEDAIIAQVYEVMDGNVSDSCIAGIRAAIRMGIA